MDNRRETTQNSTKSDDSKYPRKDGRPYDRKKYQSGEKRFPNPNERYKKRDDDFRSNREKYNPANKFGSKGSFKGKDKVKKPWEKEKTPPIVSDMQVTDGKYKGKYLKSTESPKVRPTARRIREVMFRILFRRVRAGRFLDLCAGAGTVGIEAISRGAMQATFVERSAKMCSFIKENMKSLEIKEGHGEVYETEVVPFLKKMSKRRRFWDVVYFDPPYDADYDEVLKYFERGVAIRPGGVLVIEHHAEMFFPEQVGVMKRWRVVVQGETALSFYEKK